MTEKKLSIIIHGPYSDNAYKEIFKSLLLVQNNLKRVIVSSYVNCETATKSDFWQFRKSFDIITVFSKDLINPGYFNLNRQILTVRAGLDLVDDNSFVIKLRNDQWCDMKKLFKLIEKKYLKKYENHKIMTTNCFTRKDRLYHPSDMLLCGWKQDLQEYFSLSFQENTHMDIQLEMLRKLKYSYEPFNTFLVSPESELFKHYLTLKNWDFKFTNEDSYNALKKYIYIVNTWDIDLRWSKQRNSFLPAKTIILPYSFSLEPFAGAPAECAKCYSRDSFEGHKTIRDMWFIFYARVVFSIKYNRLHRILARIKGYVPKPVKKIMTNTAMGKLFKSIS